MVFPSSLPAGNLGALFAAVLLVLALTAPAAAQNSQQFKIYGQVTPRCWVVKPVPSQAQSALLPVARKAVCNHAQPTLVSELQQLDGDAMVAGGAVRSVSQVAQQSANSSRTALRIVVSPPL